ncbi:MAG: transcriptional regulator [Bacteroidetes bacterium CG12_big_fil_rev_8_21_14_0_65_60_17]|nr:MAG: transcriptional regulator [Bacteroidetes bacterium CG12_big_fil_rev_8_21_14_0_65_60_17]
MVDLKTQYERLRPDIDRRIQSVLDSTAFIKGPEVNRFEEALGAALDAHVVAVANGTDALQIALMALGVGPGDEVITPSFTFVATAEAASLLGAVPVFADIDPRTFTMDPASLETLITGRTRAIVPVHLFGQSADMDAIMDIANRHAIPVVEDTAQAIGSTWKDQAAGTRGAFGTLSFFPSKNLGCYGDGGAVMSRSAELAERARLIANHGSRKKYHNEVVGINSRLDTLQAAILQAKLPHLDDFTRRRREAADHYDAHFADIPGITTPHRSAHSHHVFHQYTLRIHRHRDRIHDALSEAGIPSAVYYPVPLHELPIYASSPDAHVRVPLPETGRAAREVLSLPMHTELTEEQQQRIAHVILSA